MNKQVYKLIRCVATASKAARFLTLGVCLSVLATGCGHTEKNQANGQEAPDSEVQAVTSASPEASSNGPSDILSKPEVPILCYHRISPTAKGAYSVTPATFAGQIKALSDSGYHTVTPNQLYDYLLYNKALPDKPVMITFDDSRSEHGAIAAPLLEKYGFRGVFFIMTITYGKKNYLTTDEIAGLAKAGHTVGLHTWDHTMVTRYKDSIDWRKQIVDPVKRLEEIIGQPVDYFAYPNGVYNHEAATQLSNHFKLSFILFSKRDSTLPLQSVRRMIAPESSPQRLLASMRKTFNVN